MEQYIEYPGEGDPFLYYDDSVVVIKDKFPKSMIHWLVMPRDTKISKTHPLWALQDEQIWKAYQPIVEKFQERAAVELSDRLILSDKDAPYCEKIKLARHYIRAGVHADPSCDNLHIHIISSDMSMPGMKHAKHYNSFNTSFFVEFDQVPHMQQDDARLVHGNSEKVMKTAPLICWKCKMNFNRQFKQLKAHLLEECKTIFKELP